MRFLFVDATGTHEPREADETCYATELMTTVKREVHTPTTDQSEDSGVDMATSHYSGPPPRKRKRTADDAEVDAGGDESVKNAAAAVLSVNIFAGATAATTVSGCPPFRPWSNESSSTSEVGLRLFHDIRNVDKILTLTRRRRCDDQAPAAPEPLDLTKGRPDHSVSSDRTTAPPAPSDQIAEQRAPATATSDQTAVAVAPAPVTTATVTTAAVATKYSKNMSRARRIEANARERSRVHTISAAFDTLRTAIPSYSRHQKLSKLSTIRIASAYILTLSRLLDMDYSAGLDAPTVAECVDNVTGIIHMEGKARKRKDEP